jgi:hypothetical protein
MLVKKHAARTVVAIATMPERVQLLERAVASLRPQVDALKIYLNNFSKVPSFLSSEEVILSKNALGDLGDKGKFYWLNQNAADYYLTADDDIFYPPDYVERLVQEFEARHKKAIVGVHGFVFSMPIQSYSDSRSEKYKGTYKLASAKPVHVIGTATAILSAQTIKLSLNDFPKRNMADLQLAIAAQKQQVPMVVIPREENWIKELQDAAPEKGFSIWKETLQDKGRRLGAVADQEISHWQTFPDPIY